MEQGLASKTLAPLTSMEWEEMILNTDKLIEEALEETEKEILENIDKLTEEALEGVQEALERAKRVL